MVSGWHFPQESVYYPMKVNIGGDIIDDAYCTISYELKHVSSNNLKGRFSVSDAICLIYSNQKKVYTGRAAIDVDVVAHFMKVYPIEKW